MTPILHPSAARPRVPDWIRTVIPPSGWTNVFTLVPSNDYLYGTETLFGDWQGRTLLLAKDGAPTRVIRTLRDRGESRPWRHAQRELGDPGGWKTNEWLARAASSVPGGMLYGSATGNLLCDDPTWSRSLPGFFSDPLHGYLKSVLGWVLDSMQNVRSIACLGEHAWFLAATVLGRPDMARTFGQCRDSNSAIVATRGSKTIAAHALYHPAARVADESKRGGWLALASAATR